TCHKSMRLASKPAFGPAATFCLERDSRARRSPRARQRLLAAPAAIGEGISPSALARLHPTLASWRSRHDAEASAAEVQRSQFHRDRSATRERHAAEAEDALVQHRHALQHRLPQLLYRIESAE